MDRAPERRCSVHNVSPMSADATQEQRRFGRVNESVVLRREYCEKNILRDAPQMGYKNPMCVHRRLVRCAQLFELAESDFHLLDSSFVRASTRASSSAGSARRARISANSGSDGM
jgi:hypothetical protein